MGQFKPMPKMKTTEPSVELKLKKGGKVKMMDGGEPMMAAAPARRRMPMAMAPRGANPMVRAGMPMRKEGGAMDKAQDKAMVKKAFKQHDAQEHKGGKGTNLKLRGGGAPKAGPNVMGGLAGGLEATRTDKKKTTGGVRAPGYKNGGALKSAGEATAKKYMNKMNTGNPMPTVKGGTKGLEGMKFKKGGAVASKGMAVAKKYMSKMNTGNPMPTVKGKTGSIEGSKFKNGGHAEMSCKAEGGFTAMKKMAKC
jgi:hypothetical protein